MRPSPTKPILMGVSSLHHPIVTAANAA